MAKVQIKMPEDFLLKLSRLGDKTDEILPKVLEAGGEVAMVMGTEGFTMGIAVDEQDISAVAVGQEVAFTVDAVDGEYIRLWRSLHNHLFVRRQRFQWCGWQRLIPVCAGSIVIVSRPGPSQIVQRHADFGLKMDRVSDVEAV